MTTDIAKATVKACVPRQDGGYMIVLREGGAASSPVAIGDGVRVTVKAGVAQQIGRRG